MDDNLRDRVAALLREAGTDIILPRFGRLADHEIDTKSGPADLVTVADREAEEWLTPRLREIVDCAVVGEEACAADNSIRDAAAGAMAWTLDPVDGTSNFVKASDMFCSMIALVEDGVPVRSWLWMPVQKTLYYAARGEGAWRSDGDGGERRLRVGAPVLDIERMKGGANTSRLPESVRPHVRERLKPIKGHWLPHCVGYLAAQIACGEQDFLLHAKCTPWDDAPADLLCREAGAHAAMIADDAPYDAVRDDALLVVQSEEGWERLKAHIWPAEL